MVRKNTTTPQAAPVEATGNDLPKYAFEAFKWAPDDFPDTAMVRARELALLVNHVKDVADWAATVLQLMLAHSQEIDNDNATYLTPYAIGVLQQLAIRALTSLDAETTEISWRLHDLARGKS